MSAYMFATERLYVRHFHAGDLDDFAALCADPRIMRYVGDGTTLPRPEVERWISVCQRKYADRGYGTSAVFEQATNRFIGYCGIIGGEGHNFDELIYVYHMDTWGKGYATEAGRAMLAYVFERSSLKQIYATIHTDNRASIKVVEKLGFHFDRQVIDEDGSPVAYYVIERAG